MGTIFCFHFVVTIKLNIYLSVYQQIHAIFDELRRVDKKPGENAITTMVFITLSSLEKCMPNALRKYLER